MPSATCAACRERKVRCDRQIPRCSNCAKARISCPGYQLEISWPKPNNKKRSLIGPEPCTSSRLRGDGSVFYRWANTGVKDIEAHHYISTRQAIQNLHCLSGLGRPGSRADDHGSVQLEAALAITCDFSSRYLVSILTRLAFHDDSPSSQAVLHAVLAVASLRRYGANIKTIERQGKALRALETSTEAGIAGTEVAQHIAAGILLCCFEIYGTDATAGPWFVHVSSAKRLLQGLNLDRLLASEELLAVTNLLYHHDVHAQFGLRHWRRQGRLRATASSRGNAKDTIRDNTQAMTAMTRQMLKLTGISTPSHVVLWPLADIFENIVDPSHPKYHSAKYRDELEGLEHELESILNGKYAPEADHRKISTPSCTGDPEPAVLEIYRLTALIYLERASRNFSGTSSKLDAWANSAFDLMRSLRTFKHGFPIFIIGCEARTDEHRIIVTDCIDKTQGRHPTAGMHIVRDMLQSAWALEDLETEQEVNYMAKLDVVISGCETMPSFA